MLMWGSDDDVSEVADSSKSVNRVSVYVQISSGATDSREGKNEVWFALKANTDSGQGNFIQYWPSVALRRAFICIISVPLVAICLECEPDPTLPLWVS
jgi:hypothetical protein